MALNYDLHQFGPAAFDGRDRVQLCSMCTVFAESEVIGLKSGRDRRLRLAGVSYGQLDEETDPPWSAVRTWMSLPDARRIPCRNDL